MVIIVKTDKRRMNKKDREAQILNSALNVFVERGYNGATTQEIAREAGISEVTLFRYFKSKRDIFIEVIEPILFETLKNSVEISKDLDLKEKLKIILIERIKLILKYNKVIKLILMESQINPEIASFNYIEKTSELLRESISKIDINLGNSDLCLRIMIGSILSFLYLPEEDEIKLHKYVDNIVSYIMNYTL